MTLKARIKSIAKRVRSFGSHRYCPVCDQAARRFLPFGTNSRPDACCPTCGALERHRLAILFFRKKTDLFNGRPKRFLHVAPEPAFIQRFAEATGSGYLTADLKADGVMEQMDVTDIPYPDDTFDIIYCSHVLEHVPDDRKAMSEFYRSLKPGGWAVLNVPITVEVTFEDPTVTDPTERVRLFGQQDHVRRYGPDYEQRLSQAGFEVTRYTPHDLLTDAEIERFGMSNGAGDIFYCTKMAR